MKNLIGTAVPAASAGEDAVLAQRLALAGHEYLDRPLALDAAEIPGLRPLIRDSWRRSARLQANPDVPEAPLALDREELEEYRRQHPWPRSCP